MATGSGVRAGRAYVELFADDSELVRGLKQASKTLKTWGANVAKVGAGITAAGVGIVTPLLAAAKHFADTGSQLDKLTKQTGLSAKTLSRLGFAANLTGTNIESVAKAVFMMNKNLKGKGGGSPEQNFLRIIKQLSQIPNESELAAKGAEIFGKSFAEILPLLAEGEEALKKMFKQSDRLGHTFSEKDKKLADDLGDAWDELKMAIGGVSNAIGIALAPVLTPLIKQVTDILATVIKWTKANPKLVTSLLSAGAIIAVVGTAVTAIGLGLGLLGFVIAGITATLVFLTSQLGLVALAFGTFVAALIGTGAWVAFSTEFRTFMSGLVIATRETMQGIADAMSAGNVKLAIGILVLGIKVAWLEMLNEMKKEWNDFFKDLLGKGAGIAVPLFDLDAAKRQMEMLKTALGIANKVAEAGKKWGQEGSTTPTGTTPFVSTKGHGIQGTFAAGAERQFAFGTDDIPKKQLTELQKVNRNLENMEGAAWA